MRAHIAAVEALLTPLGWATYYVDVPETPATAYILLWGSSGLPSSEQPLRGPVDLTDGLGVTCVAATPYGVLSMRTAVRGVLDEAHPVVAGRVVTLSLWDSRDTQVDRDVTLPDTGRHPAFGVDVYRLMSVPA